MRRLLAVLLVAGCAPTAPIVHAGDEPCGGASGEPAPWCSGAFPGPDPPVERALSMALARELAAACPPPTADDPTPGLSPGARGDDVLPRGRGFLVMPRIEVKALEQLLAASPPGSPDVPKIRYRLVQTYRLMERMSYDRCRQTRVREAATRSALRVEERRVREIRGDMRSGREGSARHCAALAQEHPDDAQRARCP